MATAKRHIQTIYVSQCVTDKKKYPHIMLKVAGELRLPLPSLMKALVAPFALSANEKLVEQYIAKLCKVLGGEHGA